MTDTPHSKDDPPEEETTPQIPEEYSPATMPTDIPHSKDDVPDEETTPRVPAEYSPITMTDLLAQTSKRDVRFFANLDGLCD